MPYGDAAHQKEMREAKERAKLNPDPALRFVGCCEKAVQVRGCVCRIAFKCPDHHPNEKHIGTHD